jgi:hypothetical protein
MYNKYWWAGGVAQVVEGLPTKHEVLSSNPNTDWQKKGENADIYHKITIQAK